MDPCWLIKIGNVLLRAWAHNVKESQILSRATHISRLGSNRWEYQDVMEWLLAWGVLKIGNLDELISSCNKKTSTVETMVIPNQSKMYQSARIKQMGVPRFDGVMTWRVLKTGNLDEWRRRFPDSRNELNLDHPICLEVRFQKVKR